MSPLSGHLAWKAGSEHQMQTESAPKGTLAFWSEVWGKGLLRVRESEESAWLLLFSILPPWPPGNLLVAAVTAIAVAARKVPEAQREEDLL